MSKPSLPPAYFDRLYANDPDPWRFATSAYEAGKYAATLAALSGRRFRSGFEIGCSIGVLTAQLADRCDTLLACDVAEAALDQARRRNADRAGVTFENRVLPDDWPTGQHFDLIVLSEVLYYLDPAAIGRMAARTVATLAPGGVVLLVHWTGETDYPVSGDQAVALFMDGVAPDLRPSRQERMPEYRLDRLQHR